MFLSSISFFSFSASLSFSLSLSFPVRSRTDILACAITSSCLVQEMLTDTNTYTYIANRKTSFQESVYLISATQQTKPAYRALSRRAMACTNVATGAEGKKPLRLPLWMIRSTCLLIYRTRSPSISPSVSQFSLGVLLGKKAPFTESPACFYIYTHEHTDIHTCTDLYVHLDRSTYRRAYAHSRWGGYPSWECMHGRRR